ncbi:MAG TPA: hypothetical protein VFJ97_03855 [Dermatophilaceae bacterium]|nr:hypothetical protein [Dermatophilaceae bacterium]
MVERHSWTADADDTVRGALAVLRADLDAVELPDPAAVRRRGEARRRHVTRFWLSTAAAVAVGIAVAVAVALTAAPPPGLGPSPARPTPTEIHQLPTELPDLADWQSALGLAATTTLEATEEEFPRLLRCLHEPPPGRRVLAQRITDPSRGLVAFQHLYGFDTPAVARSVAEASNPERCPDFFGQALRDQAWPHVYLLSDPGFLHWRGIALSGPRVTMIDITDRGTLSLPQWRYEQVLAIAALAQDMVEALPPEPSPSPSTSVP